MKKPTAPPPVPEPPASSPTPTPAKARKTITAWKPAVPSDRRIRPAAESSAAESPTKRDHYRRYIEDDPTDPQHLTTVRGIGYRFLPNP